MHIDFPVTFIGNLPRLLFQVQNFSCRTVQLDQVKMGDIVFVAKKRGISHVAIFWNNMNLFHCTKECGGRALLESHQDFFSRYQQPLKFVPMLRHIDARTRESVEERFIEP